MIMKRFPLALFFIVSIICAGLAGMWIDQCLFGRTNAHQSALSNDMHSILHKQLATTAEQEAQLAKLEPEFNRLKDFYEGQMKDANLALAKAIEKNGYQSPETEVIIHKIHDAMGKLQALSLLHLSDMQKVLNAEQNEKLKNMVIEQLHKNAAE